MGIEAFAERARHELLATGDTVRKRTAGTASELTGQEEYIARLAVDGRRPWPASGSQTYRPSVKHDGPSEVEAVVSRAHSGQQAFDAFAGQRALPFAEHAPHDEAARHGFHRGEHDPAGQFGH